MKDFYYVYILVSETVALRDEKWVCHAGGRRGDRRRTFNAIWPPSLKDYGLAGQPSLPMIAGKSFRI